MNLQKIKRIIKKEWDTNYSIGCNFIEIDGFELTVWLDSFSNGYRISFVNPDSNRKIIMDFLK